MARPTSSPPLLAQIRAAQNHSEQTTSLRALKNDIVGHQQRKEMWLALGLIEPVVRILNANKPPSRRNGKEPRWSNSATRPLTEEEMVRFQAISVVGSLAHGGPSFIAPLHAGHVLPPVLANLNPSTNSPSLVLATLRACNSIASSTTLASGSYTPSMTVLAEALFSRQHITFLAQIIGQHSNSIPIQNQINLAANLISKVCREERHQQNLADWGVLDALATKIAAFVVSSGCVVPEAISIAQQEGIIEDMPAPASRHLDKAAILEAVSVIITGSKLRAAQLLYSPAIVAVLPSIPVSHIQPHGNDYSNAWTKFSTLSGSDQQRQLNAIDTLLPHVPRQQRNHSALASAFPPLGTSGAREHQSQTSRSSLSKFTYTSSPAWQLMPGTEGITAQEGQDSAADEPESPLVPWLFFLARSSRGLARLMAISVLTVLYRSGLTTKSRVPEFVLLIIPLLGWLFTDKAYRGKDSKDSYHDIAASLTREWAMKEHVPAILSSLITDNEAFQKAAVEAGVIKNLAKMLKAAYEPVPEPSKSRPWSPKLSANAEDIIFEDSQSSKLGSPGLSPLLLHNLRVRESILSAIAALAPFKDEYRKAMIEEGVVPYIVESLKTNPSKPSSSSSDKSDNKVEPIIDGPEITHGYGTNPVPVLIAACNAIRALARSVSILRTTLIDNGVAMPLVNLLQHPDVDVQIAATAAVCNLVLDFSPMRETISEAGILAILCRHAHSTNAKLKLNAMWALKHLVLSTGNDVKKACLRELGQGWLVQLVSENTEDDAIVPANSRGNVDKSEEPDATMIGDIDMDHVDSEHEDSQMLDAVTGGSDENQDPASGRPISSRSRSLQIARSRIAALREAERNPACKALKDDIAVQEQGLDFIRNLIGGVGVGGGAGALGAAEMVDFLFECLGQDRVFDILATKLRSKVIPSSTGSSRVQPPQQEIVIAVGYILVQMAGSVPRHRQLIISQVEMLKSLIPQFSHLNKEVRLALCHLVTNLTWVDDSSDVDECKLRIAALVSMGFLKKLEQLAEEDVELDVRERAKHAIWQMKEGM